jgi:predicted RNA methylase
MRTILSQCIAGLQDVALRALDEDLGAVERLRIEEGMLIYRTSAPVARVRALPYLNNSFLVLLTIAAKYAGHVDGAMLRSVLHDRELEAALRATAGRGERSFRVFVSSENQLVSGPPQEMAQLRSRIAAATGLRFQPSHADAQYWLMRRRSGAAYLLKRVSQRARTEKDLAPGELRPELAHLLVRLAGPRPDDVFLDPFAGSGAIPFARVEYPYELAYAFDADEAAVAAMKQRRKALPAAQRARAEKLIVRQADARELDRLQDGFIRTVVTDPPWGLFQEIGNVDDFYHASLRELTRVTAADGMVVLLTAQKEVAEAAIAAQGDALRLEESHDLLVSGKKARVFRLRRTAAPLAPP